jgi:23S rRNA pseudouridine2604 synthase
MDPMNRTPEAAPTEGTRLAKRVAELRACSRREAEQYIEGGWVRVDGQVVEEPQFRVLAQTIEIDPHASLMAVTPVTLLLHKPAGHDDGTGPDQPPGKNGQPARALLTPANHFAGDRSGIQVLKRHFNQLLAHVPLELGASGLIVFTQDWRVARKLTEDAMTMEHEFMVEVAGEVPPETVQRLAQMKSSGNQPLPNFKASLNSSGEGKSRLRVAVKGAHPGLIAHLCERAGLQILALRRIRIGRVALSDLPPGQWRYLSSHERF